MSNRSLKFNDCQHVCLKVTIYYMMMMMTMFAFVVLVYWSGPVSQGVKRCLLFNDWQHFLLKSHTSLYDDDDVRISSYEVSLKIHAARGHRAGYKKKEESPSMEENRPVQSLTCTAVPVRKGSVRTAATRRGIPSRFPCNLIIPGAYPWFLEA